MSYEEVKRIRENQTAEDCDNEELAKLIDFSIEKQIPKKQSETDKARCIHCACVVKRNERFCNNCGQALDWSDTE